MPIKFLTDERVGRHGRHTGESTEAQLARYFRLDDADRAVPSGFSARFWPIRPRYLPAWWPR